MFPPVADLVGAAPFTLTNEPSPQVRRLVERVKSRPIPPGAYPEPSQLMLPIWHDQVRGLPNPLLRSALFAALGRVKRRAVFREPMAAVGGVSIRYTGWRLDQTDLDIWMQVIQLARTSYLGTRIEFEAGAFLKAIGRDTGRGDKLWLERGLTRLTNGTVEVEVEGQEAVYFGNLLYGGLKSRDAERYVVALNPDLLELFGYGAWTAIHWGQRRLLKGQPIAQWLHSCYSTHVNEPIFYRFDTLQSLCGSESKRTRDFKDDLLAALALLKAVAGWRWEIKGAAIRIHRPLTPTQERHVQRGALARAA